MVKRDDWINTVSYTPMLRFSQLAPLLSEYFPDGVGISPATVRHPSNIRRRGTKTTGKTKETATQGDKKEAVSVGSKGTTQAGREDGTQADREEAMQVCTQEPTQEAELKQEKRQENEAGEKMEGGGIGSGGGEQGEGGGSEGGGGEGDVKKKEGSKTGDRTGRTLPLVY